MANPLVKVTLDALNNHPEEWEFDEYRAVNRKRKLDNWIGNSLWGLNINGYGGVVLFGCIIPWRVRIWRAVWRAKAAQIGAAA